MSSSTDKQARDSKPEDPKSKSQVRRVRPARLKHTVLGLPAASELPEPIKASPNEKGAASKGAAAKSDQAKAIAPKAASPKPAARPRQRSSRNALLSETTIIIAILLVAVAAYFFINR